MIRITTTSVFVNDQTKAVDFYTKVLNFQVKDDMPVGEYRWITVVNADDEKGTEMLLEPNALPAAKTYQESLYAAGIPAQMFGVDDIEKEYERLSSLGVKFTMKPKDMEGYKMAVLDDTCGNLIQLLER